MAKPVFYYDNTTGLAGAYLAYADIAIYNADGVGAKWTRHYFDRENGTDTAGWFNTTSQWFLDYDGSLGALISGGVQYALMSSAYSRNITDVRGTRAVGNTPFFFYRLA